MAQAHVTDQENDRSADAPGRLREYIGSHRGRLLWGMGLLVLLVLSVLAHGAAQFPGDAAISSLLQPLHGSPLAPVINFPSDVNQPVPGGVIALVIIVVLAVLGRLRESLAIAVGTFGADLINALINGLVARPRPHNVHVQTLSGLGAHSFPSGHVEHVTMLFGFLFYLTLLVRRAHPERWAWLLPLQLICIYFIAFIGVGRIVEGDHQPSDVLAGYLVAALLLALVIQFYWWLGSMWQRHQLRKSDRLAGQ
jgi:undecaprenyl-diphosphatase